MTLKIKLLARRSFFLNFKEFFFLQNCMNSFFRGFSFEIVASSSGKDFMKILNMRFDNILVTLGGDFSINSFLWFFSSLSIKVNVVRIFLYFSAILFQSVNRSIGFLDSKLYKDHILLLYSTGWSTLMGQTFYNQL